MHVLGVLPGSTHQQSTLDPSALDPSTISTLENYTRQQQQQMSGQQPALRNPHHTHQAHSKCAKQKKKMMNWRDSPTYDCASVTIIHTLCHSSYPIKRNQTQYNTPRCERHLILLMKQFPN